MFVFVANKLGQRCALDTRFNSFYRQDLHPFIDAMQVHLLSPEAETFR